MFRALTVVTGFIVIYATALLFNADVYKLMVLAAFAVSLDVTARDIITKIILNTEEGKALIAKLKGDDNDRNSSEDV
jgi:hypothetical protein